MNSKTNICLESMITIKGQGPILITCPHNVYTIRNNVEIHDKEYYVSKIVNELYNMLGPKRCTIMMWNEEYFKNNTIFPEDPNHIKNLKNSTWNKKLKIIKNRIQKNRNPSKKNRKQPLFHIDIHGASDNWYAHNKYLCVGTDGIKTHKPCIFSLFKSSLIKIITKNLNIPLTLNEPFNGYSEDFYTLSHQSLLQGFFSLQFELSYSLRREMVKKSTNIEKLKITIEELYESYKEILHTIKYKQCKQKQITKKRKKNKKRPNKTQKLKSKNKNKK